MVRQDDAGCWLWTGSTFRTGYGQFRDPDRKTSVYAHRYSWELHFGKIKDGLHVCHKCDVRSCINPLHLFLGTPADNMADMISKGRAVHDVGSKSSAAKLCEEDVVQIRALLRDGLTQTDIARRYGVFNSSISNIKTWKTWKHVPEDT